MKKRKIHSSKPILKVKDLSFRYPEQTEPVLNGIDLKLYPHEIRLIVGPSGCGKSTLTSAICGFIPNSIDGEFFGSVEVAGKFNENMNIYEIAKEILRNGSRYLNDRRCLNYKLRGNDLAPDPRYLPAHLFVRQLSFSCWREFQRVDQGSRLQKAFSILGAHVTTHEDTVQTVTANVTVVED